MKLTELLGHLKGFREVETDRLHSGIGLQRIGTEGQRCVFKKTHKLVSGTGTVVYASRYDDKKAENREDEPVMDLHFLFSTDFETQYWETARKLEEITGISFEEIEDSSQCKHPENWRKNYDFRQEVAKIYAGLKERVRLLVKRKLEEENITGINLEDPKIGYLHLTMGNRSAELIGGQNLRLVLTPPNNNRDHNCEEDNIPQYLKVVGILDGLAKATQDTWQRIETASIDYARHLVEIYKPALPNDQLQA